MNDTADLTRKIRALLDKAERSEFEYERDAFTAKAMALMAAHQISQAMVDAAATNTDSPGSIVERTVSLGSGPYVRARLQLLTAVASAQSCRVLTAVRASGRDAFLHGYPADVERAEVLFTSLLVQAVAEANRLEIPTGLRAVTVRRSFLFGFAVRIDERLAQMKKDAVQDFAARSDATLSSVALVLTERDAQVDAYIRSRYGNVRSMASASPVSRTGFGDGQRAASSADLGFRQVGTQRMLAT